LHNEIAEIIDLLQYFRWNIQHRLLSSSPEELPGNDGRDLFGDLSRTCRQDIINNRPNDHILITILLVQHGTAVAPRLSRRRRGSQAPEGWRTAAASIDRTHARPSRG